MPDSTPDTHEPINPSDPPALAAADEARAAMINDLLSSDGQPRPGDEILTGLADALRPLDAKVRMDVAAGLYGRAVEALNHADNARAEATYISPEQYRRNWLDTAEQTARLWREASHVV